MDVRGAENGSEKKKKRRHEGIGILHSRNSRKKKKKKKKKKREKKDKKRKFHKAVFTELLRTGRRSGRRRSCKVKKVSEVLIEWGAESHRPPLPPEIKREKGKLKRIHSSVICAQGEKTLLPLVSLFGISSCVNFLEFKIEKIWKKKKKFGRVVVTRSFRSQLWRHFKQNNLSFNQTTKWTGKNHDFSHDFFQGKIIFSFWIFKNGFSGGIFFSFHNRWTSSFEKTPDDVKYNVKGKSMKI